MRQSFLVPLAFRATHTSSFSSPPPPSLSLFLPFSSCFRTPGPSLDALCGNPIEPTLRVISQQNLSIAALTYSSRYQHHHRRTDPRDPFLILCVVGGFPWRLASSTFLVLLVSWIFMGLWSPILTRRACACTLPSAIRNLMRIDAQSRSPSFSFNLIRVSRNPILRYARQRVVPRTRK